ncbi:hypothetical protein DINM_004540 [Dirofilaria immitis]|nr:hypothetical protein [Dirofilaria immitis]
MIIYLFWRQRCPYYICKCEAAVTICGGYTTSRLLSDFPIRGPNTLPDLASEQIDDNSTVKRFQLMDDNSMTNCLTQVLTIRYQQFDVIGQKRQFRRQFDVKGATVKRPRSSSVGRKKDDKSQGKKQLSTRYCVYNIVEAEEKVLSFYSKERN